MATDFGTASPVAPRPGKTNGLAIGSLVCAILTLPVCCVPYAGGYISILLGVVAVVLGVLAINQIKVTREGGKGLAIAGAVIGGIMAVVLGVLMAVGAAFGPAMLQKLQQQQQQLEQQDDTAAPVGDEAGDLGESEDAAPDADGTMEEENTTEDETTEPGQ